MRFGNKKAGVGSGFLFGEIIVGHFLPVVTILLLLFLSRMELAQVFIGVTLGTWLRVA